LLGITPVCRLKYLPKKDWEGKFSSSLTCYIVKFPDFKRALAFCRIPWGFPEVVKSWSCPGHEEEKMQVVVYTRSEEVIPFKGKENHLMPAGLVGPVRILSKQ
jgi:hypothetical protein